MRSHHLHTTTTFELLKNFVYQTLCHHEKLEIGVFPMTQKILKKRATPCGVYFCLHGPRSVKFTAIYDAERNIVLFYGATGERFMKREWTTQTSLQTN